MCYVYKKTTVESTNGPKFLCRFHIFFVISTKKSVPELLPLLSNRIKVQNQVKKNFYQKSGDEGVANGQTLDRE